MVLIGTITSLLVPSGPARASTERARLTWNTSTDIDLHVWDDHGNHAYYGSPNGIPNATLSDDDTVGFGPEFYVDSDAPSNRSFYYCVHYYGSGDEGDDTPTTAATLQLTDPDGVARTQDFVLDHGDWGDAGSSPANILGSCDDGFIQELESHRYTIEVAAWIPQAAVVDPIYPKRFRMTRWNQVGGCMSPSRIFVRGSTFRGDNHEGYEGSYRAAAEISFDWDGETMSEFTYSEDGEYGTTHRDFDYYNWKGDRYVDSCTKEKTATKEATAGPTDVGEVFLALNAKNPMVTGSPAINSSYTVEAYGHELYVDYDTDEFPSHGIQILKDGFPIATHVVNNADCGRVLGLRGMARIGSALWGVGGNSGSLMVDLNESSGEEIATCES